ncbi:MAG: hypothetical protein KDJ16_18245, partial [Hyphomicrobiales bacterium]|nr:hypothetical protein [Hyphomicrobiales bacterium]
MFAKRIFQAAAIVATVGVLLLGALPARAQSAAEDMVKTWIAGLTATGAEVSYGRIDFEPVGDVLTIDDLSIRFGGAFPYEISANKVEIAALTPRDGGGFAARRFEIANGAVKLEGINFAITGLKATEFASPSFSGVRYDKTRPMTSMLPIVALQKEFEAKRVDIKSIQYGIDIGPESSNSAAGHASGLVVYGDLLIRDVMDGKAAEMSVGSVDGTFDTPEGAMKITYGTMTATGIDFGAYDHVLNPANYAGGKGDGIWRTVMETMVVDGLDMSMPENIGVNMGGMVIAGLKMRQTEESPAEMLALIDEVIANPGMFESEEAAKDAVPKMLGIYRMMGLNLFRMSDFKIAGPDINKADIGAIVIRDLSTDGLGEFRVDGVDFAVVDGGENINFQLANFSIADIGFPAMSAILAMQEPGAEEDPRKVLAVLPTIGSIGLAGLSVQPPNIPDSVTVGSYVLEMGRFVKNVPTFIRSKTENAVIPRSIAEADDPEAAAMFVALGIDAIDYSDEMVIDWDVEKKTFLLKPLRMSIAGFGTASLSASLAGLGGEALENPEILPALALGLTISDGVVRFDNDNGVQSMIAFIAEQEGAPADEFAAVLVASAEPALIPIVGEEFAKKVREALERFVA